MTLTILYGLGRAAPKYTNILLFLNSHVVEGEPIAINPDSVSATEKFIMKKHNNSFPVRESNPGPLTQQSRLQLLDHRDSLQKSSSKRVKELVFCNTLADRLLKMSMEFSPSLHVHLV